MPWSSSFSVVYICRRQKQCLLIQRGFLYLPANSSHLISSSYFSFAFWHFPPWSFSTLLFFPLFPQGLITWGKKTHTQNLDISSEENEFNVGNPSARSSKEHVAGLQSFWQSTGRDLAERLQAFTGGERLTWTVCWAPQSSLIFPACGSPHSL